MLLLSVCLQTYKHCNSNFNKLSPLTAHCHSQDKRYCKTMKQFLTIIVISRKIATGLSITLNADIYLGLLYMQVFVISNHLSIGQYILLFYLKVEDFLTRFANIPDIMELHHLTVSGDVTFGKDVTLKVFHVLLQYFHLSSLLLLF